jgi:hypothetical protein
MCWFIIKTNINYTHFIPRIDNGTKEFSFFQYTLNTECISSYSHRKFPIA